MSLPKGQLLPGLASASLLTLAFGLTSSQSCGQAFWPQFRGPSGNGISAEARPPVSFSPSNAAWSTELPRGHSSPVIWGDRIYLTCQDDQVLDCRAYDRPSGKLLWQRPVPVEKLEPVHAFNNQAAGTPVATAERVVFYFGSYGLIAFTPEGEKVWDKPLPPQVSRGKYGAGTSPILCGDLVVLAQDTDEGGSRLLAYRLKTGELVWETPRPLFKAGWSTPVFWSGAGRNEIVLLGSKVLTAYDPADGRELWKLPGFPIETSPSPTYEGDRLFVCSSAIGGRSSQKFDFSGYKQLLPFDKNQDTKIQFEEVPENFRFVTRAELPEGHPGRELPFEARGMIKGMDEGGDKDGALSESEWEKSMANFEGMDAPVIMALRGGAGLNEEDRVSWKFARGIPEMPSPVACRGKVFLVRDGGMLQCMDAEKGTVLYQERLGVSGGYAASPVGTPDRLYLASQSGTVTVIDPASDSLKVLARNPLGEKIAATPAVAGNTIYVRTEKHLFAFTDAPASR
jgi:outer membrane protein assembly factor BamB